MCPWHRWYSPPPRHTRARIKEFDAVEEKPLAIGSDSGGCRHADTFDFSTQFSRLNRLPGFSAASFEGEALVPSERQAQIDSATEALAVPTGAGELVDQDRRVSAASRRLSVRLKKRLGFSIAMAWICGLQGAAWS